MSDPRNQSKYQIRFDWGYDGAALVAPGAHIVVWADALATGDDFDASRIAGEAAIVAGTVGSAKAVASWVLEKQVELGDRATVAVVAAGRDGGGFAVEDLLAAGAVIDAISALGIDFISPEAAAAVGAFAGLRNATSHVLTASVTGQEIIAARGREVIDVAKKTNAAESLNVLRP